MSVDPMHRPRVDIPAFRTPRSRRRWEERRRTTPEGNRTMNQAATRSAAEERLEDAPVSTVPVSLHAFEAARLEELDTLDLTQTGIEARFQHYSDLAADICGAPAAVVSLVDRSRLVYKAVTGFDAVEHARRGSFCHYAILEDDLFVVPDARGDGRFAGGALAAEGFRAYAGVVLIGPTGHPVGTLAVLDRRPREFEVDDLERLRKLARLLEHEMRRGYRENRLRRKIERTAYYDGLTGLPNRRLCRDRLIQAVQWAGGVGRRIGVIRLDLDRFNALNNALGRAACDQILREVGHRLEDITDEGHTVARWQDDEFAVLVPSMGARSHVDEVVTNVARALEREFCVDERSYRLSVSVGVSVFPDDGSDADHLLAQAGEALRRARAASSGGGSCHFYTGTDDITMARRFELERRLRQAIALDQLHLVYQPKVDVQSRRVAGMEALLRWNEPELGFISPGEMIPIAEETGLIVDIGDWVLREACRQNRRWQEAGLRPVPVSVNVASLQLQQDDFQDRVKTLLDETGLDPNYLELEVTEHSLVEDIEATIPKMRALSDAGVTFSIDDFGTGYSSLSYLRRLPLHTLKIDRAFVDEMVENPNDAAIVHTIIAMARSLDLRVVAEGVEHREQALFLRAYRCDAIQGYLFSRPLSVDDHTALLRDDRSFDM
ncbi:MAG: putative bifunctional diguanylate cyclase/phosphodiesterase [Myxococcota bacterium]